MKKKTKREKLWSRHLLLPHELTFPKRIKKWKKPTKLVMQNFPIEMQKGSLRLMFFFCCSLLLHKTPTDFLVHWRWILCLFGYVWAIYTQFLFFFLYQLPFVLVHRTCFTNNGFKINFHFFSVVVGDGISQI